MTTQLVEKRNKPSTTFSYTELRARVNATLLEGQRKIDAVLT